MFPPCSFEVFPVSDWNPPNPSPPRPPTHLLPPPPPPNLPQNPPGGAALGSSAGRQRPLPRHRGEHRLGGALARRASRASRGERGARLRGGGRPDLLVVPFSPNFFWLGGFAYYNRLPKKVGTLILTSLEDLGGAARKVRTTQSSSPLSRLKR